MYELYSGPTPTQIIGHCVDSSEDVTISAVWFGILVI